MKFLLILSLSSLFLFSCKKDEDKPTQTGYQQYGIALPSLPATEDLVIYEVNLRAFSSAGNIQGVINRLDEIKALGVTTIWLMPIYTEGELNAVNSPYCVRDYKAVSTEYGSLADLRQLTTLAHEKGMSVILDWVANHTSWDHAWITAHKDWYTQNASGAIIQPAGTNWADVADLNFSNTAMQDAQIDAMKYWVLEANVDGFRCDYADGVPFTFWQKAITQLRSIPARSLLFLAEGTRADHYAAGFDLSYAWNFYTATKNVWNGGAASAFYATHLNEYSTIPSGKHKIRFTTNHDESAWDSSPMTLFNGKAGALAASVPTIFLGGVPLIYSGQEVGRASTTPFFTKSPINWAANPDMLQAYKQLYTIYTNSTAARKGTITNYNASSHVVTFKKTYGTEELLVLVNVRDSIVNYNIPAALQNTSWNDQRTNAAMNLGTTISLPAYSYYLLKNE